jgi:tetratricopeptide (TPR) repeat protein
MISNSVTYIKIQNLIKAQKFNEALILLEETKNNLSELEYWFLVSVSLRYLEDYKNALISLSKLIDIDPGFGRAYQEFGHVYAKLNNNKMALKSYIRAIQNNHLFSPLGLEFYHLNLLIIILYI